MYDFVSNVRYCMALCGWGYAGMNDLERPKSVELLTVRSALENDSYVYPYEMTKRVDAFWLYYPKEIGARAEDARTVAGPYLSRHTASDFIDGLPFDATNKAALHGLSTPPATSNEAWTAGELHAIRAREPRTAFFGNAVDFTVKLIRGEHPNGSFDLDGDRGYASVQWQGYPPNTEYIA
jgi:hypothetical protein